MYASRRDYILLKDIELWRKQFLGLLLNDVMSAIKVTYSSHGIRTIKCQTTTRQRFLDKTMLAKYIAH